MQNTHPSKSIHRASRSRAVTDTLPPKQLQHLERLYDESPTIKSEHWNAKRDTAYVSDIINVQSLINIRADRSKKRRDNDKSSIDDRIVINVCGDRYETHRLTLELYPDTLLGNEKRRKYYYDHIRQEYFFDRHRACFEAILYYYQSHGRLRRPEYIPLDIFMEEVTYFQLGQEALSQIRKDENIKEVKKVRLPKNRMRRCIWATMEYPDYSKTAKFINILALMMVVLSTVALAVESLPQYVHAGRSNQNKSGNGSNITTGNNNDTYQDMASGHTRHPYFKTPFFRIQSICVGYFTLEIILRIITTPSFLDFVKNIMNWIDVLAVVPYYITLGIYLADQQLKVDTGTYVGLRLLHILRLARVFKFYRVFKSVKSLRVLGTTIRQSLPDFFIMITILTLLGFLFGAAAYFAENDSNGDAFDSILKATYWGIITITSVGYGDIVPITPVGRVIACLCALSGSATIGMLVSVLVDRYQRVYARKLFVNEPEIDFNDYSDDENNDTISNDLSYFNAHRRNSTIADPDARAKQNAQFQNNLTEIPEAFKSQLEEEDSIGTSSSRVHFIFGYVDDENQDVSRNLIETIGSVVAEKQLSGESISLNIISNEQRQRSSSLDVKFALASSSDDEDLTEIINNDRGKGSVLKTFQRPLSPNDVQLNKSATNA